MTYAVCVTTHQYVGGGVLQFLVYLLPEGAQDRHYCSCGALCNFLQCLLRHMEVQLGKYLPILI